MSRLSGYVWIYVDVSGYLDERGGNVRVRWLETAVRTEIVVLEHLFQQLGE